ncbi:G protein-coupled receptor 34 like [Amia ocellicauda]|uniref:G protein-coupled receptor 34 like n=1 Tax=Amia ocellicauda TaxID=2972642 RepID=UPI003463EA98
MTGLQINMLTPSNNATMDRLTTASYSEDEKMADAGLNSSGVHNNVSCEIQDGSLSLVLPTCYSVIFIIGLLSNIVALSVFFFKKRTKTCISVYMKHLAIADFFLVLCLPVRIYYHNSPGPYFLCKTVGIFFYINMYASILFLTLISLDRYLKIIKPVWVFKIQKVKWGQRMTCAVWVVLFSGMFPFFLENNESHPCSGTCFHFHRKGLVGGIINLIVVGLFFLLAFLFLGFYGKIAIKLKSMSLGNAPQKTKQRKNIAIIKTFVVPIIFTLCFMPYHVLRVPYVLSQMDIIKGLSARQTLHVLNELVLCLSALNSCLDPIIYFFLSYTFRKTILCAFQGQFKKVYAVNLRGTSFVRSVTEI